MEVLLRRSNSRQNAATVDRLAVQRGSAVLEIGFGPGDALSALIAHEPALLAGVDHSPLMVRRTTARLSPLSDATHIDLRLAGADLLPFDSGQFDLVFAVNSFHQWPDQAQCLAEIARVLRQGGQAVLSIRVFKDDSGFEARGDGERSAMAAESGLVEAGFHGVRREDVDLGDRSIALVAGERL